MGEEQDNLAINFRKFIEVLDAIQGGRPNIHLGVVSSDVGIAPFTDGEVCIGNGDDGVLQNAPRVPSCSPPSSGARFIEDIARQDGTRMVNYPGDLEDVFGCIAKLGTSGCGLEQHLEAMKRALDGSRPQNTGFLRPNAYLAVIIIADEDDCSPKDSAIFDPATALDNLSSPIGPFGNFRCIEFGVKCDGAILSRGPGAYTSCTPRTDSYIKDPQEYVNFLRSLKPDPSLVLAAGIIAPVTPFAVDVGTGKPELQPSCNTANGLAYPGVRLSHFVKQFGAAGGQEASICQPDLSGALVEIADKLAKRIATNCLGSGVALTDINPNVPGLQLNCSVTDVSSLGAETVLPRCGMIDATTPDTTTTPCWWTKDDDVSCRDAPHVFFQVERGGAEPPVGNRTLVRCST